MHNLFLSSIICFWLGFGYIDYSLYTKSLFNQDSVKLISTCVPLWTNYYFEIESIHAFSFVNDVVYQGLLV